MQELYYLLAWAPVVACPLNTVDRCLTAIVRPDYFDPVMNVFWILRPHPNAAPTYGVLKVI
jgi:hypothetical protein